MHGVDHGRRGNAVALAEVVGVDADRLWRQLVRVADESCRGGRQRCDPLMLKMFSLADCEALYGCRAGLSGQPHHQARLGAGASAGDHDMIQDKVFFLGLEQQLLRRLHIAQCSHRVGPSAGNQIRPAPLGAQLIAHLLQCASHVGATRAIDDLSTQQYIEKDIAVMQIGVIRIRMSVFQDDSASQSEACRGSGGLPHMVGLERPQRDQMVRALLQGFAQQEFQLACLVATERHASAVIALDPNLWAPQMLCESWHELQRRGDMAQVDAGKAVEVHRAALDTASRLAQASSADTPGGGVKAIKASAPTAC